MLLGKSTVGESLTAGEQRNELSQADTPHFYATGRKHGMSSASRAPRLDEVLEEVANKNKTVRYVHTPWMPSRVKAH